MTWYWWIAMVYGIFALLIIILIMIIVVKSERQDRWQKRPDYWRLGRGAVVFGLTWLYYLIIEPLIQKKTQRKKEGREMKQSSRSSVSAEAYFDVGIALLAIVVMANLWAKTSGTNNPLVSFLVFYLALGMIMGVRENWQKFLAYRMNTELGYLYGTGSLVVLVVLSAICWSVLPIFRSGWMQRYNTGSNARHQLVVLRRIVLALLFAVSLFWLKGEMVWSWREFYIFLLIIFSLGSYLVPGFWLASDQWHYNLKYRRGIFFLVTLFEVPLIVIAWPAGVAYFLIEAYF